MSQEALYRHATNANYGALRVKGDLLCRQTMALVERSWIVLARSRGRIAESDRRMDGPITRSRQGSP
jgi:hypothetical protein